MPATCFLDNKNITGSLRPRIKLEIQKKCHYLKKYRLKIRKWGLRDSVLRDVIHDNYIRRHLVTYLDARGSIKNMKTFLKNLLRNCCKNHFTPIG